MARKIKHKTVIKTHDLRMRPSGFQRLNEDEAEENEAFIGQEQREQEAVSRLAAAALSSDASASGSSIPVAEVHQPSSSSDLPQQPIHPSIQPPSLPSSQHHVPLPPPQQQQQQQQPQYWAPQQIQQPLPPPPMRWGGIGALGGPASSGFADKLVSIRRCCCYGFLIFLSFIVLLSWSGWAYIYYHPMRVPYNTVESPSDRITQGQLSNGLRYTILPNSYPAGVFTSYLHVDVGSSDETDTQLGMAHFIEHLAFDSTQDFPGRGGLWSALSRLGASYNAFTTQRATVYQIWNAPSASDASFLQAMKIHRNQVLLQRPLDNSVYLEKGAVLGEDRYRNDSSYAVLLDALHNHGGDQWLTATRMPIGTEQTIRSWTVADTQSFFSKWYRLDRMHLIVVGDLEAKHTEQLIQQSFANDLPPSTPAPAHAPFGTPTPISPLIMREIDGLDGVQFMVLVSQPYAPPPYTFNDHRRQTLDLLSMLFYTIQATVHIQSSSPASFDASSVHAAGLEIANEFLFDTKLHLLAVVSGGTPGANGWTQDLEGALIELKRLARDGPNQLLVTAALYIIDYVFGLQESFSGYPDTQSLVNAILGSIDPRFNYLDPTQTKTMQSQYLGAGFAEAAAEHIQAEAVFMYKSILQAACSEAGISLADLGTQEGIPMDSIAAAPAATLNLFYGPQRNFSAYEDQSNNNNNQRIVTRAHLLDTIFKVAKLNNLGTSPLDNLVTGSESLSTLGSESFTFPLLSPNTVFEDIIATVSVSASAADSSSSSSSSSASTETDAPVPVLEMDTMAAMLSTMPAPQLIDNDPASSGIVRVQLSNGIPVNIKLRATGRAVNPRDMPGLLSMQIVALGGSSAESPDLKGACTVISSASASGFEVDYTLPNNRSVQIFAEDMRLAQLTASAVPMITCEQEFMVLDVPLSAMPCVTYPKLSNCDLKSADYSDILTRARLALRPIYTDKQRDEVAAALEMAEQNVKYSQTLPTVLAQHVLPSQMSKLFPNDHRMRAVTGEDIRSLNPLAISQFVRESFAVGRIEINVVGNADPETLLAQLNFLFGSIPAFSLTSSPSSFPLGRRLSYDVLDPTHQQYFTRQWPSTADMSTSCGVQTEFVNNSFVVSMYAAPDAYAYTPPVLSFTRNLFGMYMFNTVRRDHGFGYYARVQATHSWLFSGFGYYTITWEPGTYPTPASPSTDPLNIQASLAVVDAAVRGVNASIPSTLFDEQKMEIGTQAAVELQNGATWLALVRGLSLPRPPWAPTTGGGPNTLKNYVTIDVARQLRNLDCSTACSLPISSARGKARVSIDVKATLENPSGASCQNV